MIMMINKKGKSDFLFFILIFLQKTPHPAIIK